MWTIAVIDEDAAMQALMTEWLEAAGHVVATRAGADLVVFDVVHLRSIGEATVQAVKAAHPGAALIGISAQLTASLPPESAIARSLGVGRLLAKPLARDEFLAAVALALALPAPA